MTNAIELTRWHNSDWHKIFYTIKYKIIIEPKSKTMQIMKSLKSFALAGTVVLFYACGSSDKNEDKSEAQITDPEDTVQNEVETTDETEYVEATAEMTATSGSGVTGKATFTDLGDGTVTFKLMVENVSAGAHAVHIHEKGDCSASDGTSAGGHWNPTNTKHGKRAVDMEYHKGDIDNMEVGEDGKGVMEMTIEGWSIGGSDTTNILNKAVIIHEGADDFTSQPSGAAGARIACGVIKSVE